MRGNGDVTVRSYIQKPSGGISRRIFLASAAITVAAGGQVEAADEPLQSEAADVPPQPTELDTIVVTATKRETNVQKTAVAVSTMTAADLQASGIDSAMSLQSSVPSLVVGGSQGFGLPFIRGVGNEIFSVGADSSSSVYLDGVYMARPGAALSKMLDIDRVEVLRGPQGTLFGRNALGGSIILHSHKPGEQWSGSGSVQYGNFERVQMQAAANIPLIADRLYSRVAVIRTTSDGYMTALMPARPTVAAAENYDRIPYGGEDLLAGRLSLKLIASDRLDILLTGDATRDRGESTTIGTIIQELPHPPTGRFGPDAYTTYLNLLPTEKKDQAGFGLTAIWDIGFADLKSITAYRHYEQDVNFDVDATDAFLNHQRFRISSNTWTQELNLLSHPGTALEWVLGAYYLKDDGNSYAPLFLGTPGGPTLLDFTGDVHTKAWALFGQGSYAVTEQLKLTAGLRYSHEKKRSKLLNTMSVGGFLMPPIAGQAEKTWTSWTPKFGIDWSFSPDAMAYVTASRGFKSGGFNIITFDPSAFGFDPETMWAYEAGIKSEWFDRRLRVNIAGFYYDQQNRQEQVADSLGNVILKNAASATIKGVELDVQAQLAPGLRVDASYAFLDGSFDKFLTVDPDHPDLGEQDLGALGRTLPRSPRNSFSFRGTYSHDVGAIGELAWFGEVSYKSRIYHDVFNEILNSQGNFALINARISFEPRDYGWQLALYGRNLTDKLWYQTGGRNTPFFGSMHLPAEPRTYGVELGYKW